MINLLIIDPQNDFILKDAPLHVPGAKADMYRLSAFILSHKIDNIHVTLDSHHLLHIAHPIFWMDKAGNHPDPFTIITKYDVINEKWLTTDKKYRAWSYSYIKALGQMCIWPPHCLIGSNGHNVVLNLFESLKLWEEKHNKAVNYIEKGSSIWTEHFGAIVAEVPRNEDMNTQINYSLINSIYDSDVTYIAGEASSHCVAKTVESLISLVPNITSKICILEDAMSPVPGFEDLHDDFFALAKSNNIKFLTTAEF